MRPKKEKKSPTPTAIPVQMLSPRSQRSLKQQFGLEDEIGKLGNLIGQEEKRVREGEVNRTRQLGLVTGGQYIYQRNLSATLLEVEDAKRKISAYQQRISVLESEIKGLQPSASQAAERRRKQTQLARLATLREQQDAAIDSAIEGLRELLEARGARTRAMLELANEIDFEVTDSFDSERFERLLASLPGPMRPDSERWRVWFLGREPDRRPVEITHAIQTFPETLVAAGYYRRGDQALLTKKQQDESCASEPRQLTPWEVEALIQPPTKPDPLIATFRPLGIIR